MIEHHIDVRPGHLVAIDRDPDPPRVVYRWQEIAVTQAQDVDALIREGRPVDPDRLRAEAYPRIRAMYERLERAKGADPKQIVREGYDRIAERYLAWTQQVREEERARPKASFILDTLPDGAEVLDLGCGAGLPTTRALARRFRVTGVDISARQIALARENVPEARFIQADMAQLDLPPGTFDAVAAFYALIHIPRQELPALLSNIAAWLRPDGLLVATLGAVSTATGYEEDWLGAPMYWNSYDAETNLRLIREAGLQIVRAQQEAAEEFGEPVTFLWVVAQKPASR